MRIKIDGYHQPERRDRSGKRGGGRPLANVSTALNCVRRRDLECDDLELLWTEIMQPRSTSVVVCFIYRSPKLWYEQIEKLSRILKTRYVWDLTSMSWEV